MYFCSYFIGAQKSLTELFQSSHKESTQGINMQYSVSKKQSQVIITCQNNNLLSKPQNWHPREHRGNHLLILGTMDKRLPLGSQGCKIGRSHQKDIDLLSTVIQDSHNIIIKKAI